MSADPMVNTGLFTKTVYTFATLPPAAMSQGRIEWISNSTAGGDVAAGLTAVGGGTYKCKVISNGTAWKVTR
jgi:hypothetical protein